MAIAIMATLMAILLPNLMGARERAQDAQKIQNLSAVKSGLRLYYNDHQAYPTGAGVNLDVGFSAYVSNTGSTDYKYYQTDSGDGFILCTTLNSSVGTDDTDSQVKCGVTSVISSVCGLNVGSTGEGVYAVCAK